MGDSKMIIVEFSTLGLSSTSIETKKLMLEEKFRNADQITKNITIVLESDKNLVTVV